MLARSRPIPDRVANARLVKKSRIKSLYRKSMSNMPIAAFTHNSLTMSLLAVAVTAFRSLLLMLQNWIATEGPGE